MDMKTTFLNGELNEEVYMMQPEGFTSTNVSKMCKLQRSIYELKQASRSWNIYFDKVIRTYGFIRNREKFCIDKWVNSFVVIFLVLYVDDIF